MVKTTLLTLILAVSAFAHGATLDTAALTAKDAGSKITDVIFATAVACREDAQNAPNILTVILSQRKNWTDGELYQIFAAVLISSNLEKTLGDDYRAFMEKRDNGSTGVKLLRALKEYCSPQDKRFERIVEMAFEDANGKAFAAEQATRQFSGPNTNGDVANGKRDPRPHPAPVTPDPISPQN